MDATYFRQKHIQGGDGDIFANFIVSRCGCGFDKIKLKLDQYKIPYIDAYALIFPVIIDHIDDENVVDICVTKIIEVLNKYKYTTIFFAIHIRQDIICILENVLYKTINLLRVQYIDKVVAVYLNFEPLLLLDILRKELNTSSQFVDVETIFDVFKANDLILINDFPMNFMYNYSSANIDSYNLLPSKIKDFFKQNTDKYIYIKLYRQEKFTKDRLEFESITRDVWENDFDNLYDRIIKSRIEYVQDRNT